MLDAGLLLVTYVYQVAFPGGSGRFDLPERRDESFGGTLRRWLLVSGFTNTFTSGKGMSRLLSILTLFFFVVLSLYPFAWMFFSSFKNNKKFTNLPSCFPEQFDGQAYGMLLDGQFVDFTGSLWHSVLIATTQALLATLVSALAGFVLARYSFSFESIFDRSCPFNHPYP